MTRPWNLASLAIKRFPSSCCSGERAIHFKLCRAASGIERSNCSKNTRSAGTSIGSE
jgi:hypothetical protein